jgi:hypothetical protein
MFSASASELRLSSVRRWCKSSITDCHPPCGCTNSPGRGVGGVVPTQGNCAARPCQAQSGRRGLSIGGWRQLIRQIGCYGDARPLQPRHLFGETRSRRLSGEKVGAWLTPALRRATEEAADEEFPVQQTSAHCWHHLGSRSSSDDVVSWGRLYHPCDCASHHRPGRHWNLEKRVDRALGPPTSGYSRPPSARVHSAFCHDRRDFAPSGQ